MTDTRATSLAEPEVGSYFVANYPPFSVWTPGRRGARRACRRSSTPPDPACRSGCTCTSRSAGSAVTSATSACTRTRTRSRSSSISTGSRASGRWPTQTPALAGRPLDFVYFGGGTPSFLSTRQLESLVDAAVRRDVLVVGRGDHVRVRARHADATQSWRSSGGLGVTRLSLGVENFDDALLELNGRAHRSPEIWRAYDQARALGFPQINIDLIAGMLGETDANWQRCIERTLELDPDSVTIYQMELPFNTTISADILKGTGQFNEQVASWETRRRWVREAFEALEARRLRHRQRLHRGQGSVAHDVPVSRSALGRRRPRRPRRRVVRPRERRAHAESRHLGDVRRRDRSRRPAARRARTGRQTTSG